MLKYGQKYLYAGAEYYERQCRERALRNAKRRADNMESKRNRMRGSELPLAMAPELSPDSGKLREDARLAYSYKLSKE